MSSTFMKSRRARRSNAPGLTSPCALCASAAWRTKKSSGARTEVAAETTSRQTFASFVRKKT
jgi:hypothetical protein